jgi:hypothetical protein
VEFRDIRDTSQRREVGPDGEHLPGGRVGFVVTTEFDEGVDDDRPGGREVRRHGDGVATGLQRLGELMLAELQAADPGHDEGIVGGQPLGRFERRRGRCVEGWIRGLADPLEERETEIALGVRVSRVGCHERLEAGDLGDGRRGRGGSGCRGWTRKVRSGEVHQRAWRCGGGRARRRRWRGPRGASGGQQHEREGHGQPARPGVHGLGTGRSAARMTA